MAPAEVQEAAGCRIGVDYPSPIVDHTITGALCCEKLRSVMNMFHGSSGCRQEQGASPSHPLTQAQQLYYSSRCANNTTTSRHFASLLSSPRTALDHQHRKAMDSSRTNYQLKFLISGSSLNLTHTCTSPKFVNCTSSS